MPRCVAHRAGVPVAPSRQRAKLAMRGGRCEALLAAETCSRPTRLRAPAHQAGSRAAAPGACPQPDRGRPDGCSAPCGPERRSRRRDMQDGESSGLRRYMTGWRARRCGDGRSRARHGGRVLEPGAPSQVGELPRPVTVRVSHCGRAYTSAASTCRVSSALSPAGRSLEVLVRQRGRGREREKTRVRLGTSHDRASSPGACGTGGQLCRMSVVHLIEERRFNPPRPVEVGHGGRW